MIRSLSKPVAGFALAAITAFSVGSANAQDIERVEVGQLKCDVAGGVGLVLGSRKKMSCVFERNDGTSENYSGRVVKVGVDIGITKESVVWWVVLAPSDDTPAGGLAGEYVGVSAEATVAVGAGANVLVGGGNNSFALQPLSLTAQKGLNIAAGIGSIKLQFDG
ncbi:MAG: DUF992 domain-containing protein [Paracoccaceae bacterium]